MGHEGAGPAASPRKTPPGEAGESSKDTRYGRLVRFDAEGPPTRQIGKLPAGLLLLCAGAVAFLVAALVAQPN